MGVCASTNQERSNARVTKKGLILSPQPKREVVASDKFSLQHSIALSSSSWTATDSKEEIFVDTEAWLESGPEDDFVSVDGDFTPSASGASSPVHRSSFNGSLPTFETASASRSCISMQESSSILEKREAVDHQAAPKYKEIQLVQFFQDRFWTGKAGLDHNMHHKIKAQVLT